MQSYCVTLNTDTGTGDNNWIELVPPSGVQIAIYKIIVGNISASSNTVKGRLRVFRETTTGSAMIARTVESMDPSGSAAVTTCNVKQDAVFANSGTITDTLLDINFNDRQTCEWVGSSFKNWLWSGVGERIIVRLVCNLAMGNASMSVYFRE